MKVVISSRFGLNWTFGIDYCSHAPQENGVVEGWKVFFAMEEELVQELRLSIFLNSTDSYYHWWLMAMTRSKSCLPLVQIVHEFNIHFTFLLDELSID